MAAESGGPKRRLDVRQSGRLVLRQTLMSGGRLWNRSCRAAVKTSVKISGKAFVKAAVWERTPEKC